ncbi:SRPBCC family protein [Pseudonocardia sp. GCM10023141]|uniref:SRPBCC family protein n=1 Tax=Pseudonocardia sp. GCM10023141 TaxID=3252653 RepID=UPI00360F423E
MTDVSHEINATQRRIGSRTLDAGEARVLTIAQSYDTGIEDLWDACTNIERIPRWFLPISGELQVGGKYQIEGNAGGTVERCDRPNSFAATWEYGGEVSWIEVRLVAEGAERTRFELEHTAAVEDERWAEFGPGAVGIGWDMMLMGLGSHLGSGAGVRPEDAMAWMVSDEGRAFMTASSEAWYAASVAAGTPAEQARAAADRCTAAYTATG